MSSSAGLLEPAGNKAMAEERKDNAAAAASRAVHALSQGNETSKVTPFTLSLCKGALKQLLCNS